MNLPLAAKTVYPDAMCTVLEPDTTESFTGCEEARQLRETIRQLEGQSLLLESVAETRAELIRNLRVTLGLNPDINEEEDQL